MTTNWVSGNSGTQAATVGTEVTVGSTPSDASDFVAMIDTTNMVAGDIVELRAYVIINSAYIQVENQIFAGVQSDPLKQIGRVSSPGITSGMKFTLKQTAGTARNYDYSILKDTGGVVVASVAGAASNIKKNQALAEYSFLMTDSGTHAPKTGLTVTANRSLDGAAFAACANSVVELSNGIYNINLAAGDMNATVVTFRFSASGADDTFVTIITQP